MTVPLQTPVIEYNANGSTSTFAYPFMITQESDLVIKLDGVEQISGYIISGVGNEAGGDVTFTPGPAATVVVQLSRDIPIERTAFDYQFNGDLRAVTVNADFDRIWMAMQQFLQDIKRAIKLPLATSTPQEITEDAAGRANKLIGFDSSGDLVLNTTDAANVAAAQAAADAAAASAQAAADTVSSISLPSIIGKALNFLRIKADETGYETRTPAQVRGDIGAAASGVNADITSLTGLISVTGSPTFTGTAKGVTHALGDNSANLATTADVYNAVTQIPSARQTVLSGVTNAAGYAAMLVAGTGLALNLTTAAGATPMRTAFAQGALDYIATLSADVTGVVTGLPANNTSFIREDYTSLTAVAWSSTLAPPQYGIAYNQAAQSCLSLNNTNLDDFGPTWINTAVTFSNVSPIIAGTYMGVFNGTTSFFRSTSFSSLGNGSWTLRTKFRPSAVASNLVIMSALNTGGSGLSMAHSGGKLLMYLSSNGTSWDIASSVTGALTLVNGTAYDIEITYDAVAGKYFTYLNGVQDTNLTVASTSRICPINNLTAGAYYSSSASQFFSGSMQGLELLPYCAHPNGATFTPSTTLANVAAQGYASDFFNQSNMTMYQITGASTVAAANPVMTAKLRAYVGEAIAGATTISSVTNYALNLKNDTGFFAVAASTTYTKNHNIGRPFITLVTIADDINGTNERPFTLVYNGTTYVGWFPGATTRNSFSLTTAAAVGLLIGAATTTATAFYRVRNYGA